MSGNIAVTIVSWIFGLLFGGVFIWLIWNFIIKDVIAQLKATKPKKKEEESVGLMDGVFCSKCGKHNSKDKFCKFCGAMLQ